MEKDQNKAEVFEIDELDERDLENVAGGVNSGCSNDSCSGGDNKECKNKGCK